MRRWQNLPYTARRAECSFGILSTALLSAHTSEGLNASEVQAEMEVQVKFDAE